MIKLIFKKPDTYGAIASSLCVIHCLATPFIFITQTSVLHGDKSRIWWSNLDYLFLIVSFLAVARSAKTTSKFYIKPALWINWTILFLLVINEKIEFIALPEIITYIVALSLSVLHIYNLKYCECNNNKCCNHLG